MIQLHVSKALFAKLPLDNQGALPADAPTDYLNESGLLPGGLDNPLSGWHAHLFTLQRRQCVLWAHDTTRFALFMPCLTKPDFAQLQWLFVDSLMNTLIKAGANEQQLDTAHQLLRPLRIDSVCNRSVQATITRMKGDIEHTLNFNQAAVTELSAYRTGAWLADRPCNVKGKKECVWPKEAMLQLLDCVAEQSLSNSLIAQSAPPLQSSKQMAIKAPSKKSRAGSQSGGADSTTKTELIAEGKVVSLADYRKRQAKD